MNGMVRRFLIPLLAVVVTMPACAGLDDTAREDESASAIVTDGGEHEAVIRQAIEALAAGDSAPHFGMFSATLAAQLPEPTLQDAWAQTVEPAGDYLGTGDVSTRHEQGFTVVSVVSQFTERNVVADVSLGSTDEIEGIWFSYGEVERSAHPNPPDLPERATEFTVGIGSYDLPGILTLPSQSTSQAVVLLISGSGPNDCDGTFGTGGNAILRDLAYQLAEEGITSLRYDKRFHAHPELANAATTIRDEVIDDAHAAIEL